MLRHDAFGIIHRLRPIPLDSNGPRLMNAPRRALLFLFPALALALTSAIPAAHDAASVKSTAGDTQDGQAGDESDDKGDPWLVFEGEEGAGSRGEG